MGGNTDSMFDLFRSKPTYDETANEKLDNALIKQIRLLLSHKLVDSRKRL